MDSEAPRTRAEQDRDRASPTGRDRGDQDVDREGHRGRSQDRARRLAGTPTRRRPAGAACDSEAPRWASHRDSERGLALSNRCWIRHFAFLKRWLPRRDSTPLVWSKIEELCCSAEPGLPARCVTRVLSQVSHAIGGPRAGRQSRDDSAWWLHLDRLLLLVWSSSEYSTWSLTLNPNSDLQRDSAVTAPKPATAKAIGFAHLCRRRAPARPPSPP